MTVPPWEQQGMSLAQAWEVFEFPPGVEPGGLRRRWLARLVDLLLLAPFVLLVLLGTDSDSTAQRVAGVCLLAVWGAYEIGSLTRSGATLGKRLLRIRVARMDTLANPGLSSAGLRWLFLVFSLGGLPRLLLTALSPHSDGDGRQRSWADQLTGTIVIRAR
ncbi:RDD family protein [Sporichthya polymorpha]|uniref:RDD family protein n=1 Tax=Sporichthya polymorpha TaxID=35751 RepID=UPI00035CCC29|nr:RDD family protein [Sporichthya polymorpha]